MALLLLFLDLGSACSDDTDCSPTMLCVFGACDCKPGLRYNPATKHCRSSKYIKNTCILSYGIKFVSETRNCVEIPRLAELFLLFLVEHDELYQKTLTFLFIMHY